MIKDFNMRLVNGSCFNSVCQVKSDCSLFKENPTPEESEEATKQPCEQCNRFSWKRRPSYENKQKPNPEYF